MRERCNGSHDFFEDFGGGGRRVILLVRETATLEARFHSWRVHHVALGYGGLHQGWNGVIGS